MDNQNLFGQAFEQIISKIAGGNKNFQMLSKPQSFNWPVAPTGEISREAYQLMSAAPSYSPVGQFDGVGVSTLFSNYKQIFTHVGHKDSPDLSSDIQVLRDASTTLRNMITAIPGEMNNAYDVAKQNGKAVFTARFKDINDWITNSEDAQSFLEKEKNLRTQIDEKSDMILALEAANLSDAVENSNILLKVPDNNTTEFPRGWIKVKNGAGILEWQPDFTIGKTGQDWRAQLTNGTIGSTSITIEASKSNSAITSSWAGGDASFDKVFWGVQVDGKWSDTDFSSSDSSVKATINLESSTVVNITPGAWYDGGFLRQLANAGNSGTGLRILPPYTTKGGKHAMFGKGGLCPTMVTGLVVAHKPSFSITMKSSTYKSFERDIEASASLRIGPFNFEGSGGHYEKTENKSDNSITLSGSSTSDDPVIIGVMVGFPGMPEGGPLNTLVSVPETVQNGMYNYDGKGFNGLEIYSEGKIEIQAEGSYHFRIMEQV